MHEFFWLIFSFEGSTAPKVVLINEYSFSRAAETQTFTITDRKVVCDAIMQTNRWLISLSFYIHEEKWAGGSYNGEAKRHEKS